MKVSRMKQVHKGATRSFKAKLIKLWQRRIQDLEKDQQKLFLLACKQLGIKQYEEPRSTILYDALFNKWKTPAEVSRMLWPATVVTVPSSTK